MTTVMPMPLLPTMRVVFVDKDESASPGNLNKKLGRLCMGQKSTGSFIEVDINIASDSQRNLCDNISCGKEEEEVQIPFSY